MSATPTPAADTEPAVHIVTVVATVLLPDNLDRFRARLEEFLLAQGTYVVPCDWAPDPDTIADAINPDWAPVEVLDLSPTRTQRPAHVPASVPDDEVDRYLDAYPHPSA